MAEVVLDHNRADRPYYYYYPGAIVARAINAIIGIIEAILLLAFVLELIGASPASVFIGWVYSMSDRLVAPFAGAFPALALGGGSVIDISLILAMVGYALIGWLLTWLLSLASTTRV